MSPPEDEGGGGNPPLIKLLLTLFWVLIMITVGLAYKQLISCNDKEIQKFTWYVNNSDGATAGRNVDPEIYIQNSFLRTFIPKVLAFPDWRRGS